ncbi:MAG: signal peptidase I [Paramuribaculum sp.]|nr:signal peptidase I [Paramuribaculum sp.]
MSDSTATTGKKSFVEDFKQRVAATKTTRWIRFGIVAALFLAWVAWLGSWWVAIFIILLFDIYITGYIPFTWWKKSKNKTVRAVMSWVDAIVYALVLVYFVFAFIGQNYQIPSSSLEKTLLVGDYLWVNKMSYGPRVPMTPVHFPLVQNTLPIINTKSYLENPQWSYKRLKGFGNVERGDIVVFNFPAGDSVLPKLLEPGTQSRFAGADYYTLLKVLGREGLKAYKSEIGEVMYRPVDRRDNYVKRAVGLPGETISIRDGVIYIDGKPLPQPENVQFTYWFQSKYPLLDQKWEEYGIAQDDRRAAEIQPSDYYFLQENNFDTDANLPVYSAPLTQEMVNKIKSDPSTIAIVKAPVGSDEFLFPDIVSTGWTRADYGDLWIPKKGATIPLNERNWLIYNRVIRNYEGHSDAYLGKDGIVYIDGKPAKDYTFAMDYYFMMGDNRDNSLDSRYWGFVPEDHIVGKPMRVLISFDKDKSLFNGGIRWNRILKNANSGF